MPEKQFALIKESRHFTSDQNSQYHFSVFLNKGMPE